MRALTFHTCMSKRIGGSTQTILPIPLEHSRKLLSYTTHLLSMTSLMIPRFQFRSAVVQSTCRIQILSADSLWRSWTVETTVTADLGRRPMGFLMTHSSRRYYGRFEDESIDPRTFIPWAVCPKWIMPVPNAHLLQSSLHGAGLECLQWRILGNRYALTQAPIPLQPRQAFIVDVRRSPRYPFLVFRRSDCTIETPPPCMPDIPVSNTPVSG
ncbi:hypothetical protein BDV95DRAFT_665362 [Massariosphaeria phaeospora]|uniref:Uncharacterized protein n=1 Tax=Massariosphaeria phaeospora TaxID=100035 RepID=A0A7C8IG67_9PLEO|nr:hypothetical protein BDV95DRAFT_665362 [Massariosphaeria phaeospora]